VRLLGQMCNEGDVVGARKMQERLEMAHPTLLDVLTRLQIREIA
jgi:hypothetical protein